MKIVVSGTFVIVACAGGSAAAVDIAIAADAVVRGGLLAMASVRGSGDPANVMELEGKSMRYLGCA